MKNFNQKLFSATVSMLMTVTICQVATTQASDIDIYRPATTGQTRIMFVLDTSQSMSVNYDSGRNLNMACDAPPNVTVTNNNRSQPISASTVGGISIPAYTRRYCLIRNSAGQTIEINDRFTKLREGMFDVLIGRNGSARLDDNIIVGLTTFNNNSSGIVLSTARRLDSTTSDCTGKNQRSCLVDQIARMQPDDYTPTGVAYAIGAKSLLATIGTDTSTCNGNGIYVLTDGGPSGTNLVAANSTAGAMSQAITGFTCPTAWNVDATNTNPTFQFKAKTGNAENEYAWRCIAKFSDTLLKGATNRAKIKTATVGFGSFYEGLDDYTNDEKNKAAGTPLSSTNIDIQNILSRYNTITNDYANVSGGSSRADIANTALWGVYGRGGWYAASEPAQVADSILKFVDTVKPTFDPIVTGSPTIPVDALNPIQLQPYGYYATFVPKPQDNMQLWLGNLNKYHIYNGELYDNDKLIQLIQENGLINSAASGIWGAAGMLGKLPLGTFTDPDKNTKSANRVVFTNREMSGTSAIESNSLQQVTLETLFDVNAEKAKFKNDPDKRYWLNILGYQIDATTDISSMTLDTLPTAQQRQMGAVMHSKPILLTQEGKVIATKVSGSTTPTITTTGREDYLLFGSNQGMLHVVDIISGKEKFAFVPHEMMNNQKLGFLSEGNTDLGKDHLYYGIDGAWTAYTQYVSKTDGTLTVKSSDRKDFDGNDLNQAGLQWVYGGLRMGGRGYYGLDLSNINAPSLKFHINPMGTGSAEDPTGYMGKSWSKPTIAWVNWGGTRKLVMFVGGGYDDNGEVQCGDSSDATSNPNLSTYDSLNKYNNKGYECPKYNQTNQKGAGVYMFDAGDGSLLWWGSANAASTTSATTNSGVIATKADDLKYSVVSQINAVDRNSDGLVDHLFFGDLGGQAFRVDLNNNATTTGAFAKRVVPLYKGHLANGLSPRFYEMPSFSVHGGGVNGLFGVVALSSGNRSSPLAGTNTVKVAGVDQIVTTPTANDGVYVIYDNDVARTDLYSEITLRTSNVSLPAVTFGQLKAGITQTSGSGVSLAYRGGWNYKFSAEAAGKYKGMNEIYALDGMLYVNVYNKDGTGVTGSCGAGVIGNSELYQFCLPTGRCSFYDNNTSVPNSSVLGVGIIGTGLGQGYSNKGNETGLIIKKDTANHCDNVANKNKPECQLFDNSSKLKQMRWYETQ